MSVPFRKHPAVSLEVLDFVAPAIQRALRIASENLTALGVRHAICGGIAVGAYGYVRATKDVDFLAGDEAFVTRGSLVSFAPGVPFAVEAIPTDIVPLDGPTPAKSLRFIAHEIDDPIDFADMPLISPEGLVAMKLVAFRRRDRDDIINVIAAGSTTWKACLDYLKAGSRSDLVVRLEALQREAQEGL